MIKKVLIYLLFFTPILLYPQTAYKTVNSVKLKQDRTIKIHLPRNYESNKTKTYPVIIVLDGDYLFEPMAGNVDLYSYLDEIPEAIVVGINQAGSREADSFYHTENYLPDGSGAAFFEFLGMELLPLLDNNYRTSKFVAVAGHDLTANFINYYLFKDSPLFHAYINLSPELAPEMENRLFRQLSATTTKKWFYLATASKDVPGLREDSEKLNDRLQSIDNPNLNYTYHVVENASHYSLVGHAIPKALEAIFSSYAPISREEYDSQIANSDNSPYQYLIEKYELIENNYGIQAKIRLNDFLAIGKALELNQNWNDLEKLGQLATEHLPQTMLGTYYLARYYEENGDLQKAMRTYQNAYGKQEVAFLTTDFMLRKAEKIKENFGY